MPKYVYHARDQKGSLIKDFMEAANREEAIERLRKMGYMATKVKEARAQAKIELPFFRRKKVTTREMIMFSIQLANMIDSGVTILRSLSVVNKQMVNREFKQTIDQVRSDVAAGESFSNSLEKHPQIFPRLLVNIVRVGEASGNLGSVLTKFSEYLEDQAQLRENIRSALIYPVILLCLAFTIIIFLIVFILPRFVGMFQEMGVKMPVPTIVLYQLGRLVRQFWYAVIILFIALAAAIKYYVNTEKGKFNLSRLMLSIPIIGALQRNAIIARFTKTLATLFSSGVSVLSSLEIAKEILGNEVFVRNLAAVRDAVTEGQGIADALEKTGQFPPDTIQMIAVGEQTGNLDQMLDKVYSLYSKYIDYTAKRLITFLEPALLVVMGLVVGFIMASMLLPVFNMARLVNK